MARLGVVSNQHLWGRYGADQEARPQRLMQHTVFYPAQAFIDSLLSFDSFIIYLPALSLGLGRSNLA